MENPSAPKDRETPALTVRYNHRDLPLDGEQAKKYAQIGLKYEKIAQTLCFLASLCGMSVGEYVDSLDKKAQQEIIEKYKPLGEEKARGLLDYLKSKAGIADDTDEAAEFSSFFPDVDANSLPSDVQSLALERKISITDAYLRRLYLSGRLCADYAKALESQRVSTLGTMRSADMLEGSGAVGAMLKGLKK